MEAGITKKDEDENCYDSFVCPQVRYVWGGGEGGGAYEGKHARKCRQLKPSGVVGFSPLHPSTLFKYIWESMPLKKNG